MKKTCTVQSLRRDALDDAINIFLGNSKSFKKVNETSVFMPVSQKFSKKQLYAIAMSKSQTLSKIMKAKYGEKFSRDWININDRVYGDGIMINFKVPSELDVVFNARIKDIEIENARKIHEEDVKRAGAEYTDRYLFGDEDLQLKQNQKVPETFREDLENLNYTPEVMNYLYENSNKKFSREKFEALVVEITNTLRYAKSNQEILDTIKCL